MNKIKHFLIKLIFPTIKDFLINQIEENKDLLIKTINYSIDIPKMDEAKEKEFFETIYYNILNFIYLIEIK